MSEKFVSRRAFLRRSSLVGAGMAVMLAGCQPKVVEVTKIVEKVVRETVEVEKVVKEAVEVEKEVTRVVEKIVEGAPAKLPKMKIRLTERKPYTDIMLVNFQTSEPNVEVQLETIAGDFTQQMYTMAAAGTTPDVAWISDARVLPLAVNKVMLDMNPLADGDTDFDSSDIYPSMKGLGEFEGGWYMIPWAADAPVMYYNKTMLEEKGLEPPADPLKGYTVQEFQQTCGAVTDESIQQYGWLGGESWWAVYVPWMVGFGGRFYDEGKTKVLVNSPECAEAAQALADIYVKYHGAVPRGSDFGGNALLLGKACFWLMNRFYCSNLRKAEVEFEWDVAVPPRQPVRHTCGAGTMGPGVAAATADRGTEVAAWKLASTIAKPATQKHFAREYLSIPCLMSLAKDPSWYELAPPPVNRDVFLRVPELAILPPSPTNNDCGTVYVGETNKAMTDAWDEMVVGGVPAQEALDKAAKIINDCMARGGA